MTTNGLYRLLDNSAIVERLDRLESHVRRHEKNSMELLKLVRVLNSEVELIRDDQQANSFLEEEIPS